MSTRFLFVVLAFGFILAGVVSRARGDRGPRGRTWLTVGIVFAIVSFFLFTQS
jgi:hypothetical protein